MLTIGFADSASQSQVVSEASASFAAFPLRPLRFLPIEFTLFLFCTLHADSNAIALFVSSLQALVLTQRTHRYSQSSQRRYRGILPLCDLCGPHFIRFASSAKRNRVITLFSPRIDFKAKNVKIFAKVAKTLSRDPSTLRPLRASLCALCVFRQTQSRYSSLHSKHWF